MRKGLNLNKTTERLHVFLAHAGVASRRASERLILEGRVTVNGQQISELGSQVSETDTVCVDGFPVRPEAVARYLALHKPPGYICASSDPQGRPLALSLLPVGIAERLYPIGRLDYASSGLIFFTNDGAFAAKVGHPRSNIEKEYIVKTTRAIPEDLPSRFVRGIALENPESPSGEKIVFRAKSIERVAPNVVSVILIEGKNREIRRVFSHFHLHITALRRVRIGPVVLGDLAEGTSRPLTPIEIERLLRICTESVGPVQKLRAMG
jgi:23S rRNA pseudouridine2605 synthase